jgi:hypothetical protein
MSDDFHLLGVYVRRAKNAVAPFAQEPQVQPQFEAIAEAEGSYLARLRAANVHVGPSLKHIEIILDALESAAREQDVTGVISQSTALMSALPGDPTKGLRPPTPKGLQRQCSKTS